MNIHKIECEEERLPEFDDIQTALASKSPFRLTDKARDEGIRYIARISEDGRQLLFKALLCDDTFRILIEVEEDLNFVIDLLKEHNRIEMLMLHLLTNHEFTHKLAPALETSHVTELDLTTLMDYDPILRALKHNKTLKKLTLSLEVKPDDFDSLVDAISNENLEDIKVTLYTRPSADEEISSFWTALKPVLSAHKSLKSLSMRTLNSTAYQVLGEVLAKNSTIQRLELRDYNDVHISCDNMTQLCIGLVANTTLQDLELSYLMDGAAGVLFASLAHDRCQVSNIEIESSTLSDEDMRLLRDSLKTNTKLTKLDFEHCGLGHRFAMLCEGLKHNKTVKNLCLLYDNLSQSVTAMCDMLMHNGNMTTLNLSCCYVDDEKCHEIGAMLAKNKSLTDLTLVFDQANDLSSIYQALLHNTTLKKLYLDTGINAVTGVKNLLVHNRTLRHVKVGLNIDEVQSDSTLAVNILCEGIKHNDSVVSLVFDCLHMFSSVSLQKFMTALQDNYALDRISLSLRNCPLKALAQPLLQRNRQLKSDIQFKVAILSHNIALSSHALTILPREIWKQILSSIMSPGMEPFDDLVETIFKSYE